jgi:Mrp family chromosome partitioning ATPase/capsular polysaccharide biosynthesis protein
MSPDHVGHENSTLRDYLGVVRRRKWIILQAVVLFTAAAVLFSLYQQPLYEANAEVLLSRQNLAANLTNTPDPFASQQADRIAQTQADLAGVPTVAERALEAAGITDRTTEDLLGRSEVSAKTNADLLEFKVTDPDPAVASRLATAYADEFTKYRRELDTASIQRALSEVETEIAELEAANEHQSALYASLVDKQQQLKTMEALQTANAFVVRAAAEAAQVQPKPVRNGILGLALGLIIGIGLAFLREALDTRVRSAGEIGERLGLPLLARLPEPPRRLQKKGRLVTIEEPSSAGAEAFRVLRTNLDFVNLERGARSIMITSAVEGEGKSTTAANLAVSLARAGRRVVLVDLDLRMPFIDTLFELDERPGLTHVALGHARLADALVPVPLGNGTHAPNGNAAEHPTRAGLLRFDRSAAGPGGGNGRVQVEGALEVLASGPVPPDTVEFFGARVLADLLDDLQERADVVVIDAPPLLHLGDALALSSRVDGLVVVTRLNIVRRPMLSELSRVLEMCPAVKLGFVLTGADREDGYGYGYGGYYHAHEREPERVA